MTLANIALTAANDLAWATQPPHDIDRIIGLYAETTTDTSTLAYGKNNDQLVNQLRHRDHSHTGPPDPTTATSNTRPTTDPHLGAIDAAVALIATTATTIDQRASHHADIHPARTHTWTTRSRRLTTATLQIHHASAHLNDAAHHDHHLEALIRTDLAETTAWLDHTLRAIWSTARGDTKQPATQRTITTCTSCSTWRTGTIAVQAGLCAQCRDFKKHHGCVPTEAIVRRWDYSQPATPGQILEAKAHARTKQRKAS